MLHLLSATVGLATTIVAGGAALSYNQLDGADSASPAFGFRAIRDVRWPGGRRPSTCGLGRCPGVVPGLISRPLGIAMKEALWEPQPTLPPSPDLQAPDVAQRSSYT